MAEAPQPLGAPQKTSANASNNPTGQPTGQPSPAAGFFPYAGYLPGYSADDAYQDSLMQDWESFQRNWQQAQASAYPTQSVYLPTTYAQATADVSPNTEYSTENGVDWFRIIGFYGFFYVVFVLPMSIIGFPISKLLFEPIMQLIFPIAGGNSLWKTLLIMSLFYWGTVGFNAVMRLGSGPKSSHPKGSRQKRA